MVHHAQRAHPEWQIPGGVLSFEPGMLESHAAEVKAEGNRLFWNPDTQRFNACVDADGKTHDYGFTFLNLESIYYDFATTEHARAILSWINGDRTVAGDTAQGRLNASRLAANTASRCTFGRSSIGLKTC